MGYSRSGTLPNHYRVLLPGAMGIMLIYDITSRKTFDSIQRWVTNIHSLASNDVEKLVVANKCDVADRRVVSYEEGLQKAGQFGIRFLETSAKTGENVSKAFEELTLAILRKTPARGQETSTVTQGHRNPPFWSWQEELVL
ncbi:unnamed protein product [Heterobilharzia americana]|nr:unnamed protein product [Heterobilharzia americana]